MTILVALLFLAVLATESHACTEPDSFSGVKFGAPFDEAKPVIDKIGEAPSPPSTRRH